MSHCTSVRTIYFGVSSSPFIGSIDDVEVYDRVLSPEEIRQRYLAGLPRHKNADKIKHSS